MTKELKNEVFSKLGSAIDLLVEAQNLISSNCYAGFVSSEDSKLYDAINDAYLHIDDIVTDFELG